MSEFVDLTPTDEGYADITAQFILNVLSFTPEKHRKSVSVLLANIVDTSYYLGYKTRVFNPDSTTELRERIKRHARIQSEVEEGN